MSPDEILLINDGTFLLRMIARRLEESGYSIWVAELPERALELLSNQVFELVVIKLSEEDLERLAVLQMVKELSPETKLVIISDADFLPIEVFEADFDDYVNLPCSPSKLWRRLAVFLEEPFSSHQRELLIHPANYRIVHRLVANLQEIQRNLRAGEVGLQALQEKVTPQQWRDWADNLEPAQQNNSRSIFLVEKLLDNFAGHDFFQDQVDCYDI